MIDGQGAVDQAPYRGSGYLQRLSRVVERHVTTLVTFPIRSIAIHKLADRIQNIKFVNGGDVVPGAIA